MLTEQQIAALAADLESFRVERKAAISEKSAKTAIEEAICAFANDLPGAGEPGLILVGVNDRTGEPAGLAIDDRLLLSLTSIKTDGNIQPMPTMHVRKVLLGGVPVAAVEVEPSHLTPVRLRGLAYVRVGPRRGIATREDERILTERRRSWDLPFDQRPVHGTGLDDLDLDLFRREYLPGAVAPAVLRENHRAPAEQLAALLLASPDGVPTVTGHLVLGRQPSTFIKGAYVQFLRLAGKELTDPIVDQRELHGPVGQVLVELEALTRANIRVGAQVTGVSLQVDMPDYPSEAMQQLLRNAVMHRNYETSNAPVQWYWFDDRVEIHNPGGLFGRVTPDTFGRPGGNDYRNPTIANALKTLGFVQRFGLGVPLARKACAENGNPPPEFLFEPNTFGVVVRARSQA